MSALLTGEILKNRNDWHHFADGVISISCTVGCPSKDSCICCNTNYFVDALYSKRRKYGEKCVKNREALQNNRTVLLSILQSLFLMVHKWKNNCEEI